MTVTAGGFYGSKYHSNNSSGVIAKYNLDALANLGVCPRPLRCDRRTENAKLSMLQPFFRYNDTDSFSFSGMNSFMYENSVSNQRIESWWGNTLKTRNTVVNVLLQGYARYEFIRCNKPCAC